MTKKRWLFWLCAGLFLFWLQGCGPTRLAGGTETQNPEIVACVKKLAGAAFDAADAGNKWQPTSYLQDSAGASLGKTAKRSGDSASALPVKVLSSTSDTVTIGDSVIIRDTALVNVTGIRLDTLIVDSARFFTDTLSDTVRSSVNGGSRISITVSLAADSIIVHDTVVMTDTIIRQYKRATVSIRRLSQESILPLVVSTDTQRILLDTFGNNRTSQNVSDLTGTFNLSPAPSWKLDGIVYSSINAPLSYRVVSAPTKDTVLVSPSAGALRTRDNDLFLSSKLFDNDVLVQTVRFQVIDSLLSIGRFNPSPLDTVDSLSTVYSVDVGVNEFSGADDRLLGVTRSYFYRLGAYSRLDLSLSPDQANALSGANKLYYGTVGMKVFYSDDKTGVFSGMVNNDRSLIGLYEVDGKKYQVSCDSAYKTSIVEMTP